MNRLDPPQEHRPMRPGISARLRVTVVASLLVFASAANADWLVTQDGGKIEINGSWEERGGLLIFHLTDGTLASMKKSQVDLDESLRVTRAALEQSARTADTVAPPRQKAAFILTDADVRHGSDQESTEESLPGGETEGSDPVREAVEVTGWKKTDLPTGEGLALTGTARNVSQDTVAGLSLEVVVLDHDGDVQATFPATLGATSLAPRQSCTFSSDLVAVFDIAAVRFRFDFIPVRTDSAPAAAQATQRPEQE